MLLGNCTSFICPKPTERPGGFTYSHIQHMDEEADFALLIPAKDKIAKIPAWRRAKVNAAVVVASPVRLLYLLAVLCFSSQFLNS